MADVAAPATGEHTYLFNVSMSCGGCSGAVERVLKKLEGASAPLQKKKKKKYSWISSTTRPLSALLCGPCLLDLLVRTVLLVQKKQSKELTNVRGKTNTGVKSYEVSLETQTATVVAEDSLPYEKVLRTIAKTGKKVNSGEADGVAQSVEVPAE